MVASKVVSTDKNIFKVGNDDSIDVILMSSLQESQASRSEEFYKKGVLKNSPKLFVPWSLQHATSQNRDSGTGVLRRPIL